MKPDSTVSAHEITTWRVRPFVLLLAGFFAMMIVIYIAVGGMTASWTHHVWPTNGPVLPPQGRAGWEQGPPQLQTQASLDLQQLRAREFVRLHTTGWTDDAHVYATIPIERAMQMLSRAQTDGNLGQLLPAAQPATPIDLQNQKSGEAPKTP